jgi:hypothetical protein
MRSNPFESFGGIPAGYTTDVAPFVKGRLLEQVVASAPDAGIYHVTSNLPAVLATGRVLSRFQLRMLGVGAGGLGGGPNDQDANTVSTGVTFSGALRIAKGLRVMSSALRGRLSARAALKAMEEVNAPSLRLIGRLFQDAVFARYGERIEDAMESVLSARKGPDLYEALQFWENSMFATIADLERLYYLEPEDYFCNAPVGFLEPPAVFAAVKPENVGILQLAARKDASVREVVSECELRFNPADLLIAAVWK